MPIPHEFSAMINAALNFNFREAQRLNFETYDLHKWLYIEGNPVGIKSATEILGLTSNEVRLPLAPLSEKNYASLKAEMERVATSKESLSV
jgi:4-hydroxy-tetrahydrodipicolinate synthase